MTIRGSAAFGFGIHRNTRRRVEADLNPSLASSSTWPPLVREFLFQGVPELGNTLFAAAILSLQLLNRVRRQTYIFQGFRRVCHIVLGVRDVLLDLRYVFIALFR